MYLRFYPFSYLLPDSFILSLAKIRLCYFALEPNNRATRLRIETELNEFFRSIGISFIYTKCDYVNNPAELIEQKKLAVNISFSITPFNRLRSYDIIMGPRKWDYETAINFSETQLIEIFTNQAFEITPRDLEPSH